MMLLGIDWFVVEEKQQLMCCSFVKWLFPCTLLDFVLCTIYMMYIYPYPFFFSGK